MYVAVRLSVLLVVSLLVCVCVAQHDETVSPGAKGSGVVEAVCSRLEFSCAFPEDRLFTRRLAYVESYDGTHPETYRVGYHGGIWQVDKVMFDLTQNTITRSILLPTIQKIRLAFGIDWPMIQWADLRKPLYSAIGARLYIQYTARLLPQIPRSIPDQANYWVRYYRVAEKAEVFSREANKLEKVCSNTNGADIVFILDDSGSVGSADFLKVKDFVKDIVRSFSVGLGTNQNRIAVTAFSTSVRREFDLNDYTTQQAVLNAVDRVTYSGGGTATHLALEELSKQSFSVARGARPKESGHPRVGIVVTDGKSADPDLTKISAKKVHDADITVFAVGVGSTVNEDELKAIASNPTCLHLMRLIDFQEFESLKYIIEKRICEAPIVISPEDNSTVVLPPDGGQNCQIKVPKDGTTIQIEVSGGVIFFYVAGSTYPSSDFFEFIIVVTPGRLGVIYIGKLISSATDGFMFCSIKGDNSTNTNITIDGKPGDHDKCRNKICHNGGECVQLKTGSAWCECGPHFTGQNCETAIDFCESNSCTNGRCISGVGQFTCDCKPGYTGAKCQTAIDFCETNPCLNGRCISGVGQFTCECKAGYTGATCQTMIDLCVSTSCLNGGTCTMAGTGVRCICAPGFTGPNCLLDKNECSPNPCANGGTCTDKVNGYVCTCAPGFTGSNCLTDKNECSPNPCANGGTCTDKVNGYVCTCAPGFTGSNCLTVIDLCVSNSCLNGGTCTMAGTGVRCICAPGFTGPSCLLVIDPCKSNSCLNGATCIVSGVGFRCVCAPGFTGPDCQIEKNECSPNPCANGGTCTGKVNGYVCTCPPGFTGSNCLTAIITTSRPTTTSATHGDRYNCETNNPCFNPENRNTNRPYFPHDDPTKFIQCREYGQCFVNSCPSGTVWNTVAYACATPAPATTTSRPGDDKYDCYTNNPCLNQDNINNRRFFFSHVDPTKYIQCNELGTCYNKPCYAGTVWNQATRMCIVPAKGYGK